MKENGFEFHDFGCYTTGSVDYPEYAYKVAKSVADGEAEFGIICCGTGIGVSMAANKVKGIRAAVCTDEFCAEMTRRHNNANIITIGARVVGSELAKMIVDSFFNAEFEGGRHARRVDKITAIEEKYSKD